MDGYRYQTISTTSISIRIHSRHTVRSETRPYDLGQLADRLNIPHHRILNPRRGLYRAHTVVPHLDQQMYGMTCRSKSRTHLVAVLEQLHVSALGHFESHLEGISIWFLLVVVKKVLRWLRYQKTRTFP